MTTLIEAVRQSKVAARTSGGQHSISGFDYQVHTALLNYLRAASEISSEMPDLRYEEIADYAIFGDETWFTSEVKQTLNVRQLHSALNVLLEVRQLAERVEQSLVARLRFRICYIRSDIAAKENAALAWAQQQPDPTIAEAVVEALEFSNEPDPHGELISILTTEYRIRQPQALIDKWIRHIMADAAGRSSLAGEIAHELSSARRSATDTPFIVLSQEDREPTEVDLLADGFLVSSQPTISHLREGYFAPGGERVDRVAASLWDWYESLASSPQVSFGARIPLFWIEGPSGAGKSILLLQTLARLNASPQVTVLWLAEAVEGLPEAVRFAKAVSGLRRVVIGLDDPLSRGIDEVSAYFRRAISELVPVRQHRQFDSLPIVVCCGPSEQLADFREQYDDEFEIKTLYHGIPSDDFAGDLRTWYLRRTGDTRELPLREPNMLPLQLFFEWWQHADIGVFARRFRRRIRSMGNPALEKFIDHVIALNRLYVGYPRAAVEKLNPQTRDNLAVLERDLHFGATKIGRREVWLSHPHLAEILYNIWHPSMQKTHNRSAHLINALLEAVDADEGGYAHSGIVLALLEPLGIAENKRSAAGRRVRRQDAAKALARAAEVLRPRADRLGFHALGAWIRVDVLAPACVQSWDPLAIAMEALETANTSSPGLVTMLLAIVDGSDIAAVDRVRDFLDAHSDWDEWALVVERLVAWYHQDEISGMIGRGVRANRADPARVQLLTRLIRRSDESGELAAVGREILGDPNSAPEGVGSLTAELIGRSDADRRAAVSWLLRDIRQENGPGLTVALATPAAPVEFLHAANHWLLRYPTDPAANSLFATTLTWFKFRNHEYRTALGRQLNSPHAVIDSDLLSRIMTILERDIDHASWPFMLDALSDTQRSAPEIQRLGRAWLAANPASKGWASVWVLLARGVAEEDAELIRYAMENLPYFVNTDRWSYITRQMYDIAPSVVRTGHFRESLEWLRANPESDMGWGHLYTYLAERAESCRPELERLSYEWLENRPDAVTWSYVWRAASSAAEGRHRQELAALALDWLAVPRRGWGQVFRHLVKLELVPAERQERAETWLQNNLRDDQWPAVFDLVMVQAGREKATNLLAAWFDEMADEDSKVGFLWAVAVESGRYPGLSMEPALREHVIRWLRRSARVRTWWHIWWFIYAEEPTSKVLLEIAISVETFRHRIYGISNRLSKMAVGSPAVAAAIWEVLAGAAERGPAWIPIWRDLGVATRDPMFFQLGIRVFNEPEDPDFTLIWKTLWDEFSGVRERTYLEDVGIEWCERRGHHYWAGVWLRLAVDPSPTQADRIWAAGIAWAAEPRNATAFKFEEVQAALADHAQGSLEVVAVRDAELGAGQR
ncbi:hypothetical protein [Nocardia sp. NPDC057353]|uniref:hypothetical protein n=1 Tax=Nocardia sp. NPDC057353 TaxID=3346104 RepID=UPI003642AC04